MQSAPIDSLPGFRRCIAITPAPGRVRCEVEDDYHCMGVTVHHDGRVAKGVEAVVMRAPWNTCPGATAVLQQTFTGVALSAFAARGEKRANCTHLHDLAVLAAAHALDEQPLLYELLVSDGVEGRRRAELRRNGKTVLGWALMDGGIVEPAELAGLRLDNMRPWIDSLDPVQQEEARVLRWGTMLADGRTGVWDKETLTRGMTSGVCYTFQAPRWAKAQRTGVIRDFSDGSAQPLEGRRPAP